MCNFGECFSSFSSQTTNYKLQTVPVAVGILSTSKWKERVPDWIPLSSCLIDSSSVTTRSDGPDECDCSDWSLNVRAEGNCNKGATRPGPGTQGQFKDAINIHAAGPSSHCTSSRCGTFYLSPSDTRRRSKSYFFYFQLDSHPPCIRG